MSRIWIFQYRSIHWSDGIWTVMAIQESSRWRISRAASSFRLGNLIGRPEELPDGSHHFFLGFRGHGESVTLPGLASLRSKHFIYERYFKNYITHEVIMV